MKHARTHTLLGMVLATFLLLVGCAQAPLDYPRKASWAISNPQESRLAMTLGPQASGHPTQSGFCLLANGPDALITRLALVDAAERTLDTQCFLIEDDTVGNLFLDHMLAAADRGVRVRLLLDDWNLRGHDRRMAGIGAQPNVEVRIFNPTGPPRWSALTMACHYLFGPRRLLNRMHNKAMIVDNTVAIVGGRNIADGYFKASGDFDLGDMDILAAGPIAAGVSAAFDAFWNDRLAVPVEAFVSREHTPAYLRQTRQELDAFRAAASSSPYASYLHGTQPPRKFDVTQLPLVWADGEVLYDSPAKVLTTIDKNPSVYMVFKLRDVLDAATAEALVISPYFIPGQSGMECCRQMRYRDVTLKVLTNSLASTDEIAPHAAYERSRADLLRIGVELYELRPEPDRRGRDQREDEGPSAGAGLHAKCLIVDRSVVFVGSFNLDPRSVEMDTQNGILVRSPELAKKLAAVFAKRSSPGYAYRVSFLNGSPGTHDSRLVWTDEKDGKAVRYTDEPLSGPGRRLQAWLLGWLAPDAWL